MAEQLTLGGGVASRAVISPCGQYRYRLEREWGPEPKAGWIMCNPSTADAEVDDPTIRKCIGFARRWGCGGIVVVNVCAYRATKPGALLQVNDPVGVRNLEAFDRLRYDRAFYVANGRSGVKALVAGWGDALPKALAHHAEQALGWLVGEPVMCLGRTKGRGNPRHPLMLSYDTPLELYAGAEDER